MLLFCLRWVVSISTGIQLFFISTCIIYISDYMAVDSVRATGHDLSGIKAAVLST